MTKAAPRKREALSAREVNRARNLFEYRGGADRLTSLPQYVLVELTQGCNLACPMCRSEKLSLKGRTMPLALFDSIADTVFETAQMVDLRGWGESLLLPHVDYCISRAAEAGAVVRFVTNLAMRAPPVALLANYGCRVAVSIDTVEPGLYGVLRRGGLFERMRENLAALVAAYRAQDVPLDRIVLNTTVTAPGIGGLADLVAFAAGMGISEVRMSEVFAAPDSPLSLAGRDAEVDAALRSAAQRAEALSVRLVAATRLGSMPLKEEGGAACLHPWSYVLFAHDGGVGFCDHLNGPDGEDYILASLYDLPFAEIWNGPAWRELRREHLGARRKSAANFAECAWCYKHRFVDFETAFLPEAEQTLVTCG